MANPISVPTGNNNNNNFMMVALVPLPSQLHGWLNKSGNVSAVKTSLPMKNVLASPLKPTTTSSAPSSSPLPPPPPPSPAPVTPEATTTPGASKTPAPANGRLQGAVWEVVRRLQHLVSDDDCEVAQSLFSVDDNGRIRLTLPAFDWPNRPHYATREGLAEVVALAQKHMPTLVGATLCTAGMAYLQPSLALRYASRHFQTGLYPWLGAGVARLAARPATVLAAAGGAPLLLAAIPAYYIYLVLGEAIRVASELATDATQLATVVQLVLERCEPVFRAAEGLPADAALRVIALGLKQHLPGHIADVVKQAVYVGQLTGNMSPRLTEVLEAAADWAHGEPGRGMLDQLVRMSDPEAAEVSYGQDAPCAA